MIRRRKTSTLAGPAARRRRSRPQGLVPAVLGAARARPGWKTVAWGAAFLLIGLGVAWLLRPVLAVLVASAGIAYLLDPGADWLERRGLSREAAIGVLFSTAVLSALVFLLLLVPAFASEAAQLEAQLGTTEVNLYPRLEPILVEVGSRIGRDITLSADNIELMKARFPQFLQENLPRVQSLLTQAGSELFTRGIGLLNAVVNLTLLPIFVYYLLLDWDRMVAWIHDQIPHAFRDRVTRVAREVDQRLNAFVRGQVTIASAMGGLYSVGLLVSGVDLAVPIGLLAGAIAVVPYLGFIVGISMALVVSLIEFGIDIHLLYVVGVFSVVQVIEGTLLTPRIMGDSVGLHPLVVMVAIIAGGALLGVWGMLLAIPIAAVLSVFGAEWLALYRASKTFSEGLEPDTAGPREQAHG